MAEYELATASRERRHCCSRSLHRHLMVRVRGSLDEFEVKIRRFECACGEILSDRVKIAVVHKGIEDEDLRCHSFLHAARLWTYPFVREEVRSITLTGPVPMDDSAVYKGKSSGEGKGEEKKGKTGSKGKAKGKNKEKDPAAEP